MAHTWYNPNPNDNDLPTQGAILSDTERELDLLKKRHAKASKYLKDSLDPEYQYTPHMLYLVEMANRVLEGKLDEYL